MKSRYLLINLLLFLFALFESVIPSYICSVRFDGLVMFAYQYQLINCFKAITFLIKAISKLKNASSEANFASFEEKFKKYLIFKEIVL